MKSRAQVQPLGVDNEVESRTVCVVIQYDHVLAAGVQRARGQIMVVTVKG